MNGPAGPGAGAGEITGAGVKPNADKARPRDAVPLHLRNARLDIDFGDFTARSFLLNTPFEHAEAASQFRFGVVQCKTSIGPFGIWAKRARVALSL